MLYFGALGAFFVVDFLLNPKTSTFEGHQIFVMLPLVLEIVLLTSFLITSSISSTLSVIILIVVDFSIAGILELFEWNNKRKLKRNHSHNLPVLS
jgi:hypothetical protein